MIITQTPFRMSFFGGGTDMESFFRENLAKQSESIEQQSGEIAERGMPT